MSTMGSSTVATTSGAAIAATDVLNGRQTFSSTTGATTLITVPQGRTWVGIIGATCVALEAAGGAVAATATATFTTAGTGVTPSAGTYLVISAQTGANAATGLTGDNDSTFGYIPFVVIAPAGNGVTIAVASTNAGTTSLVDAFASGTLQ